MGGLSNHLGEDTPGLTSSLTNTGSFGNDVKYVYVCMVVTPYSLFAAVSHHETDISPAALTPPPGRLTNRKGRGQIRR